MLRTVHHPPTNCLCAKSLPPSPADPPWTRPGQSLSFPVPPPLQNKVLQDGTRNPREPLSETVTWTSVPFQIHLLTYSRRRALLPTSHPSSRVTFPNDHLRPPGPGAPVPPLTVSPRHVPGTSPPVSPPEPSSVGDRAPQRESSREIRSPPVNPDSTMDFGPSWVLTGPRPNPSTKLPRRTSKLPYSLP